MIRLSALCLALTLSVACGCAKEIDTGNPRAELKRIVDSCIAKMKESLECDPMFDSNFGESVSSKVLVAPRYTADKTGGTWSISTDYAMEYMQGSVQDYDYNQESEIASITFEIRRQVLAPAFGRPMDYATRYKVSLIYDNGGFIVDKINWSHRADKGGTWEDKGVTKNENLVITSLLSGLVEM